MGARHSEYRDAPALSRTATAPTAVLWVRRIDVVGLAHHLALRGVLLTPQAACASQDLCVVVSVLVVDDDPQWRDFMRLILTASGLTVVAEASSIAAALDAARLHRPAAALVDLGLPDGDGTALARDLLKFAWRPRVVLTSTDPDGMRGCDLTSMGVAGFVSKENLPEADLHALLAGG
jgi:CheY-like chemotaxis protein